MDGAPIRTPDTLLGFRKLFRVKSPSRALIGRNLHQPPKDARIVTQKHVLKGVEMIKNSVGLLLSGLQALAQSAFEREAKDRVEIEKLMWYARALDTLNVDAYIATYTPHGQFGAGPNATKSDAALHKLIAVLHQQQRRDRIENRPKASSDVSLKHESVSRICL